MIKRSQEVIRKVMDFACASGFQILNLEYSPIRGPEGNIEYLLYLQSGGDVPASDAVFVDPAAVVEESHQNLEG